MLQCLRVRNLAIIEEVEVEFGEGLNIVTGETGSGKSILVRALELVLGGKARAEDLRTGAPQVEIEALFDIGDAQEVLQRLADAGLTSGEELIVRRTISASNRSRSYVNGRLVTSEQLSQLIEGVADISSQHEHHSLVHPAHHLRYLDAFAELEPLTSRCASLFQEASQAAKALRDAEQAADKRDDRMEYLRFQLREIEALQPRADEEEGLELERDRLRFAERLASVAGRAEDALYADDQAISSLLAKISAELGQASTWDARLVPFAEQLDAACGMIEEAARELGAYAREVVVDPERLSEIEERLDALKRLKRKHGGSIETLLAYQQGASEELRSLEHYEESLAEHRQRFEKARSATAEVAKELRKRRQAAAKRLGKAISQELRSLGMGEAEVRVELSPLEGRGAEVEIEGARLSPSGIDRAEFLIAPNRGEEARPLRRVASGGELSRALLAIKRVLAEMGPSGLYVFDEIDTGVGGAVAEVIGRKLKEVADHHQVLCITHLPQIAAFADRHYLVRKQALGSRTLSSIHLMSAQEQLEEMARMLGGIKISAKTRAAASEMLRDAKS